MKFKLNLKQVRTAVIGLTLALLVAGGGYWFGRRGIVFSWQNSPSVTIERALPAEREGLNFSLFWEVWDQIEATYINKENLDPRQMVYGAIRGLVASLGDPYTVFLAPEENKQVKDDLGGSFEGVGIQLGYKDGNLAVIAPLVGMPAEKVGVRAGDLILKVEDEETTGITLPEAVRLIRGPKGSTVKLTLLHEGEANPYEVLITRETIVVPSVVVDFFNGQKAKVAHLRLMRFGERTGDEWQAAVQQIVNQCGPGQLANCQGVVLDLRNNPGGYLSGSVFIASEFLDSGVVVQQESADGQRESFSVNRQGQLAQAPLVVLVNQGSASASEIVAGALREYQRAKLVGEPTFGKGTIQEAQDLAGGSGLHVTTAQWLMPSGESVDKEGLVPDFQLKDNPETESDEQLAKAEEVLRN